MYIEVFLIMIILTLLVIANGLRVIHQAILNQTTSQKREAASLVLLLRGVQARQDEQTELQKKGFVIKPDYNKLSGSRNV
jgi:ectoine hydroxylase-related dioxygenase (phytanoyl-CoA dioxygenase family)